MDWKENEPYSNLLLKTLYYIIYTYVYMSVCAYALKIGDRKYINKLK